MQDWTRALEHQLRVQFPFDLIEPVAKGEFGGDVLQHVRDQSGQLCGKILWESKRTKAWSDSWLTKLKGDQRAAHADLAVIVSQTMPKDVTHFDHMDGIWVSSLACILPVANALRVSIIELAGARRSNEGQETKAQQIYTYLIGPRFKHRVECIAEKFTELRSDLDKERKWMNKQWAKRDTELLAVLEATSGMYGDLQGIAGQNLKEIDALEGPMRLELKSQSPVRALAWAGPERVHTVLKEIEGKVPRTDVIKVAQQASRFPRWLADAVSRSAGIARQQLPRQMEPLIGSAAIQR